MSVLSLSDISALQGDRIQVNRSDLRHFNSAGQSGGDVKAKPVKFEDMLLENLNNVNDAQMDSSALLQQMITDPDSVDVHEVTTAMAKAEMSLNLTKSVIDKAVKAYKEIMTLR